MYPDDDSPEVDLDIETPTDGPEDGDNAEDSGDKPGQSNADTVLSKRLKDTQAAYTRSQMELAELRGRLSALEAPVTKREDVKDWIDDYQVDDLEFGPKDTKEMLKRLRSEVAQAIEARDQFFLNKVENANPEVHELRDEIDRLRQDPDLAKFDDKVLVVLAKKNKASRERREASERGPSAPGGRRTGTQGKAEDIRDNPLFRKIYENRFPDLFKGDK
jgi:hypothetical protein